MRQRQIYYLCNADISIQEERNWVFGGEDFEVLVVVVTASLKNGMKPSSMTVDIEIVTIFFFLYSKIRRKFFIFWVVCRIAF